MGSLSTSGPARDHNASVNFHAAPSITLPPGSHPKVTAGVKSMLWHVLHVHQLSLLRDVMSSQFS